MLYDKYKINFNPTDLLLFLEVLILFGVWYFWYYVVENK